MEGSPFLPLSEGLHIEQVTPYSDELLVHFAPEGVLIPECMESHR